MKTFVLLLVLAVLSAAAACVVGALPQRNKRVLFKDDFSDPSTMDVTSPAAKWTLAVGFEGGKYTVRDSTAVWSMNPVARLVPDAYGFLANIYQLRSPKLPAGVTGYGVAPDQTLRMEIEAAFRLNNATAHPFGGQVTDPENDPRLGTCLAVIQSGQFAMCAAMTNKAVHTWHEAFKYPMYDGMYDPSAFQGYVAWKANSARRTPEQFSKIAVEYDRANKEIRYFVDGHLVDRITNPGQYPPNNGAQITLKFTDPADAKNEIVDLATFGASVACLTEIDKVNPLDPASTVGLLNMATPESRFTKPTSWVSSNDPSDVSLRYQTFGQGMDFAMKKFQVSVYTSPSIQEIEREVRRASQEQEQDE